MILVENWGSDMIAYAISHSSCCRGVFDLCRFWITKTEINIIKQNKNSESFLTKR